MSLIRRCVKEPFPGLSHLFGALLSGAACVLQPGQTPEPARIADLVARLPFALVESDDAARRILRGVARNQAVIAFPFYARLLWARHGGTAPARVAEQLSALADAAHAHAAWATGG